MKNTNIRGGGGESIYDSRAAAGGVGGSRVFSSLSLSLYVWASSQVRLVAEEKAHIPHPPPPRREIGV